MSSSIDPPGPLAETTAGEQDRAEALIAGAIACPADRGGLVVAMRQLCRCLALAAEQFEPGEALARWHAAAEAMSKRLREEAGSQPNLVTFSADMRRLPVYGAFLTPFAAGAGEIHALRALALLGRAIVAAACAGQALPPGLVGGIASVLRSLSGASQANAWSSLARALPLSGEETRVLIEREGRSPARAFLVALLASATLQIESPEQLLRPKRRQAAHSGEVAEEAEDDASAGSDEEDGRDDDAVKTHVGWLIQRSMFVGIRARFGVTGDWGVLTLPELRFVCEAIMATLVPGHPERFLALLAVISLVSSLPGKLALTLPLAPGTDMWLTRDFSHLAWCLVRATDLDRARTMAPQDVAPHEIIEIALPRCAQRVAGELSDAALKSTTLGELLAGSAGAGAIRGLLERYRCWLRALGEGWKHGVLDARFAQSLSQVYRAQAGDVIAALLALDFRECSLGMLHYVALPREFLRAQSNAAFRSVGLGPAAAVAT
jgi:hypothetical protein